MELMTERVGGTLIARVSGRIDGTNAHEFEKSLNDAVGSGVRALVLDLAGLIYISSVGLRAVLLTAREMRSADIRFALCSLCLPVRDVFTISGFDQVIDIHETQFSARSAVGT